MPTAQRPAETQPLFRYTTESARPFTSLLFVVPMLLAYEWGVVSLGPDAIRNGADVWLRQLLGLVGFGQYFLLPLTTIAILAGWHYIRRDSWQTTWSVFPQMAAESLAYALLLLGGALLLQQGFLLMQVTEAEPANNMGGRIIGYCGAGIYEELLFRLMLLPVLAALFRRFSADGQGGMLWAMVTTSFLFSAAHYQFFTAGGYEFDWYSFSFRFAAGMFFATLFIRRGFGIAAGCHTAYDILVEVI